MKLVGKVVANNGALLVHRELPSDDDQAIKSLEINAKGVGVNWHSRVFAARRLVNFRGLHYFILHWSLLLLKIISNHWKSRGVMKIVPDKTKAEHANRY